MIAWFGRARQEEPNLDACIPPEWLRSLHRGFAHSDIRWLIHKAAFGFDPFRIGRQYSASRQTVIAVDRACFVSL
jgi:hypothetical protein